MTSFDAIAYINEPRWRHSSLGLERIMLLLQMLGNPQSRFQSVHVAGTNGKGSVCAYLSSILHASGLKVGLFTSPYIERFEERIQVNGESISLDELTDVTLKVRDAAEEVEAETGEHPTEFELMCAVGFLHFARSGCDIAVVECGLGGRLDATNVVNPVLSVITRIGLDHTDILGDTLAQIAAEKAGIIKPGVPVVSAPQDPEAARVIEERCRESGNPLFAADYSELHDEGFSETAGAVRSRSDASSPRTNSRKTSASGFLGSFGLTSARSAQTPSVIMRRFSYRGIQYETSMLAAYQPKNAAVAIDAATVLATWYPELGITKGAIEKGIANAEWPGRFEVISRQPLVIVDGAHNPDGAAALALSAKELLGDDGQKAMLVVGVLADKDWRNVIAPMIPFARRVVVYAPDNPRALSALELAEGVRQAGLDAGKALEVIVAESAQDAIMRAMQKEGPEGVVLAFGTLYSIGDMKQAVRDYSSVGVSRP